MAIRKHFSQAIAGGHPLILLLLQHSMNEQRREGKKEKQSGMEEKRERETDKVSKNVGEDVFLSFESRERERETVFGKQNLAVKRD